MTVTSSINPTNPPHYHHPTLPPCVESQKTGYAGTRIVGHAIVSRISLTGSECRCCRMPGRVLVVAKLRPSHRGTLSWCLQAEQSDVEQTRRSRFGLRTVVRGVGVDRDTRPDVLLMPLGPSELCPLGQREIMRLKNQCRKRL